ncbi:hypothetical protein LX32DRAFT_40377 [Colletotrichum zoysiae]|uniref:Uncharacterized protein n=1 Tax=Colletotrichum zoysiae TaxID=1216348 RepID=A0AAD9HD64_9PEZI|nr:hypothetical protein LX32DRAFT_40377 [Colletotrichum zoysiae]
MLPESWPWRRGEGEPRTPTLHDDGHAMTGRSTPPVRSGRGPGLQEARLFAGPFQVARTHCSARYCTKYVAWIDAWKGWRDAYLYTKRNSVSSSPSLSSYFFPIFIFIFIARFRAGRGIFSSLRFLFFLFFLSFLFPRWRSGGGAWMHKLKSLTQNVSGRRQVEAPGYRHCSSSMTLHVDSYLR